MCHDYRKIAIQNYTVRIRLKLGIQISGIKQKSFISVIENFFLLPRGTGVGFMLIKLYGNIRRREIHEFSCSELSANSKFRRAFPVTQSSIDGNGLPIDIAPSVLT